MATKDKPGKFDCYANAMNDEPMFVLLARDEKAPARVREWAEYYKAEKLKENAAAAKMPPGEWSNGRLTVAQYEKYCEALDCADAMEAWSKNWQNNKRVQDQKRELANPPQRA